MLAAVLPGEGTARHSAGPRPGARLEPRLQVNGTARSSLSFQRDRITANRQYAVVTASTRHCKASVLGSRSADSPLLIAYFRTI